MPKNPAKKSVAKTEPAAAKIEPAAEAEKAAADRGEEAASASEEEAPAPKTKAKAKGKAKKKKEESSSSSSDSSGSDSSSSDEEAAAPKSKAKGKAKPAAATEESAEPAAAAEKSANGGEEKEEKAVFEPPPRPVFKPHNEEPEITGPQDIQYCPTCGLPPDFCIWGPTWAKCQPWCMQNYPQYYPELCGVSLDDAKKKAAEAVAKGKVKELPGGKKKVEASPEVTIKKLSRGGRKCVTVVTGMDFFGVKLDDAAKKFKKKFSCGVSVVKGEGGAPDSVDIQGDFEDEATDIMVAEFGIDRKKITVLEDGTKKKGKPR